jgi:hypothetical protein
MWVIMQSECSILLAACEAAGTALQIGEVEGGVTLTEYYSIPVIQYIEAHSHLPDPSAVNSF